MRESAEEERREKLRVRVRLPLFSPPPHSPAPATPYFLDTDALEPRVIRNKRGYSLKTNVFYYFFGGGGSIFLRTIVATVTILMLIVFPKSELE